jgi:hypothetical protein
MIHFGLMIVIDEQSLIKLPVGTNKRWDRVAIFRSSFLTAAGSEIPKVFSPRRSD